MDDTIEQLRLLAGMLGSHGYEVRPVPSGRLALEAAHLSPPDLILLDITMPEMSGLDVCARLRDSPATRDIPIIFLTGLSDASDKVKGFEAGGVDYITKPFHPDEVLARVKTHLALRQAQREISDAYERLRDLEQLRDNLVHMVVHDMRSPLSIALGYLGFVEEEADGVLSPRSLSDLRMAIAAGETLRAMTNELLDVSRLESGKMPVERADCDVAALARTVTGTVAASQPERSVTTSGSAAAQASCDAALVRRVVENLLSNALKHTPPDAQIVVGVSARDGHVRVTVSDDGPGVPEEIRPRLFEKFQTAKAWKDGTQHSAGLGLAFCKLAVDAHGGAIGVDPGQPRGSVFWFDLPTA